MVAKQNIDNSDVHLLSREFDVPEINLASIVVMVKPEHQWLSICHRRLWLGHWHLAGRGSLVHTQGRLTSLSTVNLLLDLPHFR